MTEGNVVVIGGYGNVGQVVCTMLGNRIPGRVFAAGRNLEKAEAFSVETGRRVLPLEVDVSDIRSVEAALEGARLVVMCVDQKDTDFVRACIDRGVHYVDVTASYAFLSQVEKLDTLARQRGVTSVLSVGLVPGVSNLLAKHCKNALGTVRNLDIYVLLGLGEAHGEAAVRWMIEKLPERFAVRRAGASRMAGNFEEPKKTVFPGGYGRRTAYLFDFADQHTVSRTLGIDNVATRLCFDSAPVTWLMALLKRARLFEMLARFGLQDVLVGFFTRFQMGSDDFVVKAEAEETADGVSQTHSCAVSGRSEGYSTGVVAALVAERLYTSDMERGVYHIEQLFDPEPFLRRLAEYHFTVVLDEPK